MSDFTKEQQKAIETLTTNISVSAGAGSGKTRVLVERFLRLLSTGKASADSILAITFTKKAAKEMRERVRNSLNESYRAATPEKKEMWRKELRLLDKAQICTIDSFCGKILRDNPVEAALDPNYTICEEYELDEFYSECAEKFMLKQLQKKDKAFQALLDNYGPRRLKDYLLSLIDSLPELLRIKSLAAPYQERLQAEDSLKAEALECLRALLSVKNNVGAKTKLYATVSELEVKQEQIVELIQNGEYTALLNYLEGLSSGRSKISEEVKNFKEAFSALAAFPIDVLASQLILEWQSTLKDFYAYLTESAKAKEHFSFEDIIYQAITLLQTQPQILERYRRNYKFLMVDEFQDVNSIQKELIYLLAGGKKDCLNDQRLFVVGDAKQSIYRFRGAEVGIFKTVRDDIAASGGENISLTSNFRSTPQIIDACNCLFQALLGADENDEVFYQLQEAHGENGAVPSLMLLHAPKSEAKEGDRQEAELIASKIKELLEREPNLGYADVTILIPVVALAERYAQALKVVGIPYRILDGRGFYERQEIVDIINLLTFLANTEKDLPLVGLLRSPYFAISDNLLTSCLYQKQVSLWKTITDDEFLQALKGADCRLSEAAKKLRRLVKAAFAQGLPEIFNCIYEVLKVETILKGQKFGAEKAANVAKLRALANDFALTQGGSLVDFLDKVKTLRAAKAREGTAILPENSDSVTIMTIHKSKGLEFPVVILPSLHFSGSQDRDSLLFLPHIGFAFKVVNENNSLEEPYVYRCFKEISKGQQEAEKIRQLYVAMTRAEKHLILSGVVLMKDDNTEVDQENSWLGALRRVLAADKDSADAFHIEDFNESPPLIAVDNRRQEAYALTEQIFEQTKPLTVKKDKVVLSASALLEYDYCQRRYYYNHVVHMPKVQPEAAEAGTGHAPANMIGDVVHGAMEIMQQYSLQEALKLAVQKIEVPECFREDVLKAAEALLNDYCDSSLYASIKDFTCQTEVGFETELFELDGKSVCFSGSIDRLMFLPDDTLSIVDYKTGAPHDNGEEINGYVRQLVIYALAAQKLFSKKVVKAQLHFLRNSTSWCLPMENLSALTETLKLVCAELLTKQIEAEFVANSGETRCRYCAYSYFCRKK